MILVYKINKILIVIAIIVMISALVFPFYFDPNSCEKCEDRLQPPGKNYILGLLYIVLTFWIFIPFTIIIFVLIYAIRRVRRK